MKAKAKKKSKTTKVVINVCHGGFSLSPKATAAYYKRKGKDCYFYKQDLSNGEYKYTKVDEPEGLFWCAFSTDKVEDIDYDKNNLNARPSKRSDPDLIEVVEELGDEANGTFAELKIVEVPDDVEWHIDEYDGKEWVSEDHRTWS